MKLFKKVESVLDRYKYLRYYFSNLLTLVRMTEASVLHRVDLLSHKAVGDLEQLYTILSENEQKFTSKTKSYQQISKELTAVSSTVSSFLSELLKKKILNSKDPLMDYFMAMSDHTSGIYRDIDKIIQKAGSEKMSQMRINNEIAGIFWLTDLKSKYIIHLGELWEKVIKFFKKYGFYLPFLSEFNQKTICDMLDPNRQYFIAANDLSILFKQLTHPNNIEKLYQQTTITKTLPPTKIPQRMANNLKLRFKNKLDIKTNLHNNDLIEINGDQVILSDGTAVKNAFANITRFGADPHNEIFLKHEYISRSQFIIITDVKDNGFYIVCTSPSNSTRVMYQAPTPLREEMLIKLGKAELFHIQKLKNYQQEILEEPADDKTVTHLPTRQKVAVSQMHVQLLTGKCKNKVVVLQHRATAHKDTFTFGSSAQDDVLCETGAQVAYQGGEFRVSPNAEVLLKTSSQYNGLRPSRRLRLKEGDRVFAEEFEFEVVA